MTNVYLSEQEQIQAVKDWLKKYGLSIVIGVAVALLGSYAYRYWQQQQLIMAERASIIYAQMLGSVAKNQPQQLQQFADQLMTEYKRTPYAALAGLMLAKNAVNNSKYDFAVEKLQWVISHARDSAVRQIARIRAARILLAQNKAVEALALIQTVDNPQFQPAIDEVRGDILATQGNKGEARAAYQAALEKIPTSAMNRMWLQMKFDQLADGTKNS
ncbi:MAG: tetratricopeptide repeat protein [Gammaproteobacteria bacterium]